MTFEIMYRGHYFPGQRNYHFRWSEKGGEEREVKHEQRAKVSGSCGGAGVTPAWAEPTAEERAGGSIFPKALGTWASHITITQLLDLGKKKLSSAANSA